jgi:hypothetical protein
MVSAGLALTAHAEEAKVTTGAMSAKVGAEFRAELTRDDHGLLKTGSETPDTTTTIGVETANLKLDGNINKETEFHFRFNLFNPGMRGPMDYGYGVHWFSSTMGLSVGRERVMQGGWITLDDGFRDHWTTAFQNDLAYYEYDDAISLRLKMAGEVVVQLLNDKTQGATDPMMKGEWAKSEHPTFAVAWMGAFGAIKPIVDLGFYDQQKSRWLDVGAKTTMAGVEGSLDIRNSSVSHKVADSNGKATSATDSANAYTLHAAYDIKKTAKPWLFYSSFKKTPYSDTSVRPAGTTGTAAEVNGVDPQTGMPMFNNNKTVLGFGADLDMMGSGWTPFVAYVMTSGDELNAKGTKETRTDGMLRLGVLGEF